MLILGIGHIAQSGAETYPVPARRKGFCDAEDPVPIFACTASQTITAQHQREALQPEIVQDDVSRKPLLVGVAFADHSRPGLDVGDPCQALKPFDQTA